MATSVDVQVLRTLHRILKQRTDLNERKSKGPRKTKIAEAAEKELEAALADVTEQKKRTRMNADQKQLQLQEREARIEDLKGKRNACNSNREYQLLNDTIAADEQASSVLADEIFEQLEKLDQIEINLTAAKDALERAKQETGKIRQSVEQELAIVEADLAVVLTELEQVEAKLPRDIKAEYDRLVPTLDENVLATVDDNTCGNCYTVLSAQVTSELLLGHAVFCKSCGSLLYLGEKASV